MSDRIYNVVKSEVQPKNYSLIFSSIISSVIKAPVKMDLRAQCSPIVDQGKLGSCTGNAIASGLREFLLIKSTGVNPLNVDRLSRLFIYYEERKLENTIDQDAGAQIADGMKVLLSMGVALESDDPYDINTFTTAPTDTAIQNALNYRVTSTEKLSTTKQVKLALASGLPVVIGMEVFESFESHAIANTGKMPMPKKGEQNLGGHCVTIVGYDDLQKVFIVRNSWGEGWGDKGYFYMPYAYATKHTWDYWTAKV